MRVLATLGACAALAATSALSADFVGFESDGWYGVNLDGSSAAIGSGAEFAAIDIYAQFDTNETDGFGYADATVLSIFDATIEMSDGRTFNQADVAGGSWDPKFSFDLPAAGSLPWVDSFVAIGGDPGSTNNTNLDPNFDPSTGGFVPEGAGWFTGAPEALQGRVDGDLRTFLGRFVVTNIDAIGESISFSAMMSSNYGIGTGTYFDSGSDSWEIVPAPGALALLGLGGIVARRRRG
jgi:MYXO-CTERM domain-containing protein